MDAENVGDVRSDTLCAADLEGEPVLDGDRENDGEREGEGVPLENFDGDALPSEGDGGTESEGKMVTVPEVDLDADGERE